MGRFLSEFEEGEVARSSINPLDYESSVKSDEREGNLQLSPSMRPNGAVMALRYVILFLV